MLQTVQSTAVITVDLLVQRLRGKEREVALRATVERMKLRVHKEKIKREKMTEYRLRRNRTERENEGEDAARFCKEI